MKSWPTNDTPSVLSVTSVVALVGICALLARVLAWAPTEIEGPVGQLCSWESSRVLVPVTHRGWKGLPTATSPLLAEGIRPQAYKITTRKRTI